MWTTILGLAGKVSGTVWLKVAEYLAVFFLGVVITHQLEKGDIAKLETQIATQKATGALEHQVQAEAALKQLSDSANLVRAAAGAYAISANTLAPLIAQAKEGLSHAPPIPADCVLDPIRVSVVRQAITASNAAGSPSGLRPGGTVPFVGPPAP